MKVELDYQSFCWSLYYAPALLRRQLHLLATISYYFFHKIQIINEILSSLCSTCSYSIDFQHVLPSWELQQITDMLYVREIAEKFLSTLLLMFIPSCYFRDTRRDAVAEKESDMVIQMTLEHVWAQTFKKKEMDEKSKDKYKIRLGSENVSDYG